MWSKLVLLPHFQQFPDLGLPCFQLGNIVFIAAPGAVDAAANLVDVRGGTADSGSQLLLLGVVHLDDVSRRSTSSGRKRRNCGCQAGSSCGEPCSIPAHSGRFLCGWVVYGLAY